MKKILGITSVLVFIILIFYNCNFSKEKELLIDLSKKIKNDEEKLDILSKIENENAIFIEELKENSKFNEENKDLYEIFKSRYENLYYNIDEIEAINKKAQEVKVKIDDTIIDKLNFNIDDKIKEEYRNIKDKLISE